MGMLLSVTSAEDVDRITLDEVEALTKGTFTGPERVLAQMRISKYWPKSVLPKSVLPKNYGQPVQSKVPTLIFSGMLDPVTPPKWGAVVHKNFPNSVHVVVPTAHDVGGAEVEAIKKMFLDKGSVEGLDTEAIKNMQTPKYQLTIE